MQLLKHRAGISEEAFYIRPDELFESIPSNIFRGTSLPMLAVDAAAVLFAITGVINVTIFIRLAAIDHADIRQVAEPAFHETPQQVSARRVPVANEPVHLENFLRSLPGRFVYDRWHCAADKFSARVLGPLPVFVLAHVRRIDDEVSNAAGSPHS